MASLQIDEVRIQDPQNCKILATKTSILQRPRHRYKKMSSPVSSLPLATSNFSRPSANFHPSIWGDSFIAYAEDTTEVDDSIKQHALKLKEEVIKMLISEIDNLSQKLNLIDTVQRLGVSHHFENEIAQALKKIHSMYTHNDIITHDDDLHSLALLFRLLRQDGYYISPDVFNKFKDVEGKFNQKITNDVRGMLSLYQAAHLRVHGEDILDKALDFTCTHLKSLTSQLSPLEAQIINHSLRYPLRKGLPRLEARTYISFYQADPSHNEILLSFAKLDFTMLQKLHRKEVGNISMWWKDLDFSSKLSFARNRMVECYLWTLGIYFEPQYSVARKITTKVIALASTIDDIYDAYGTIEELQLFTYAIERWDIRCLDYLPDYMKICYKALLDIYEDIEQEMAKEGRAYCVKYAKEEMKNLVKAYFVEAKWCNSKYVPTVSEYLSNSTISSGYLMLAATSFVGMGDIATEEIFKWLNDEPKIIKALLFLCRVMDDIVSNEFEQNRGGHAPSVLECYMKQHKVSREDAIDELRKEVVNAWKDINAECLRPAQVSMTFLTRILNLARVMDAFYEDEDCYTNPGGAMKNYIKTLLVDEVPV